MRSWCTRANAWLRTLVLRDQVYASSDDYHQGVIEVQKHCCVYVCACVVGTDVDVALYTAPHCTTAQSVASRWRDIVCSLRCYKDRQPTRCKIVSVMCVYCGSCMALLRVHHSNNVSVVRCGVARRQLDWTHRFVNDHKLHDKSIVGEVNHGGRREINQVTSLHSTDLCLTALPNQRLCMLTFVCVRMCP